MALNSAKQLKLLKALTRSMVHAKHNPPHEHTCSLTHIQLYRGKMVGSMSTLQGKGLSASFCASFKTLTYKNVEQ